MILNWWFELDYDLNYKTCLIYTFQDGITIDHRLCVSTQYSLVFLYDVGVITITNDFISIDVIHGYISIQCKCFTIKKLNMINIVWSIKIYYRINDSLSSWINIQQLLFYRLVFKFTLDYFQCSIADLCSTFVRYLQCCWPVAVNIQWC